MLSITKGEKLTKNQFALSCNIKNLDNAKLILEMHIKRNKVFNNITLFQ